MNFGLAKKTYASQEEAIYDIAVQAGISPSKFARFLSLAFGKRFLEPNYLMELADRIKYSSKGSWSSNSLVALKKAGL